MSDLENDSSYANLQAEPSLHQHLAHAKHTADVAALQHALQVAQEEVASRKRKHEESKKAARHKLDEAVRTYASKLATAESELRAVEERMRSLERAKNTSAKELEGNLAQTISLYSVIQQHQATLEQQRVKCEQSDAQFTATSGKLKSAEKELVRLRLLLEREHDSNERHIQAQKGQLSIKTDECLSLTAKLEALQNEYVNHRDALELKIEKLEKERSILEAVNFELHAEKEKCHQLTRENGDMKADLLKKAHVEGQHAAALEQILTLQTTVQRLEDERAAWTGERRDLDHALGERAQQLKHVTGERDASHIQAASLQRQLEAQAEEHARRLEADKEAAAQRDQAHAAQVAELEAANARLLAQIAGHESTIGEQRAENKTLLDTVAELEALLREAGKTDVVRSETLAALESSTASLSEQLEVVTTRADELAAQLADAQRGLDRTQESREALVEKLDANYSNSYTAQIFQKWKAEYRLQTQVRSVEEGRASTDQLQAETKTLTEGKADLEARLVNAHKDFESALMVERAQLIGEKVAEVEAAETRHKAELDDLHQRHAQALARARIDWEDSAILQADRARDEQREKERRIQEERVKIRGEVEEARKQELEALKSKEVSSSIARRPSVQSLVGHVVQAALHMSPSRRRSSRSPERRHRSRSRRHNDTERSSRSPSPRERSRSSKARDYPTVSLGGTLTEPLPNAFAPVAYPYGAVPPNLSASVGSAGSGVPIDVLRAAEQQHAIQAMAAAEHARRSASHERRRHHHHHHRHAESNESSPRGHHHSRSSSTRHRSSSPPTMQPFQLPAHFAPFVHAIPPQPQPFQQQDSLSVPSQVLPAGHPSIPSAQASQAASQRSRAPSISASVAGSTRPTHSRQASATGPTHSRQGSSTGPTHSRQVSSKSSVSQAPVPAASNVNLLQGSSRDSSATNTARTARSTTSIASAAHSVSSKSRTQHNIPPLPLPIQPGSTVSTTRTAVSTKSSKSVKDTATSATPSVCPVTSDPATVGAGGDSSSASAAAPPAKCQRALLAEGLDAFLAQAAEAPTKKKRGSVDLQQ